jgi:hypothetical protein
MSQIAAVAFFRPVFTCFADPESRNISCLLLISFLLRARDGRLSRRREAVGSRESGAHRRRARALQPMRDFRRSFAADAAKRNIRLYR